MAPCLPEKAIPEARDISNGLQLASLRKAIPQEAFQKSLVKSSFYLLFDCTMWLSSVCAIYTLSNSPVWSQLPLWQQSIATVLYWLVSGLAMWCMFMIGHDCGHTTFSDFSLVNDIVGLLVHGSLLVPYFPWKLSHHRHHMYHNHMDKDYSHPWYTPEKFNRPDESLARMMHNEPLLAITFPIYGWHLYLYGMPDGSHYFPFKTQRMWATAEDSDRVKCVISTAVVLAFLAGIFMACGSSFPKFAYYYLAPYVVFGWWLVTVTYLQHHSPDTLVYDDKDWKFVDAAFETVDRKFGYGIDTLTHHITDGHVAHHLFFTKIPHYHLPVATKAIREYMESHGMGHIYKCEDTFDFPLRVHRYFYQFGLRATKASDKKINGDNSNGHGSKKSD